jgi:flagellar hook-basal body complex protein FliE
MPIGPVEGSPIPLLGPHEPFASEIAPATEPEGDALSAAGDTFLNLVAQANQKNQTALQMSQAIAAGQSDDIHGTMIAVSEAAIETRLMVNVKDKVMDAFYEIWRMNI